MTKSRKSPQRRLLEAMVTLNAINHGRPVPDMEKISGWAVSIPPTTNKDEVKNLIRNAQQKDGIAIHKKRGT